MHFLIRIALTLLLLFGVYQETGIWTALTLGLVALSIEVVAVQLKRILLTH